MTTTTKANGTTKAQAKNSAHAGPGKMPATVTRSHTERAELIALNRISAAPFLNIRSEVRQDGAGTVEDPSRGYAGLVISIAADGQKNPCVVRPNPKYGQPGEREFLLVTGFTRYRAQSDLATGQADTILRSAGAGLFTEAQIQGFRTDKGTVLAVVRNLSEGEAAIENAADNMLTQSLNAADTAFAIVRAASMNPGMKHETLATKLGTSQPYVTKILNIADKVKNARVTITDGGPELPLFQAWRQSPGKGHLTNKVLETIAAEDDPKKQADLFDKAARGVKITNGDKQPRPTGSKRGPGAWLDNACTNVEAYGWDLHDLVLDDVIQTEPDAWTWDALVTLVGPMGEKEGAKRLEPTAAQKAKVLKAFCKGLVNGRPEETEEEEEEPAPKAKGGKKSGK